MMYLITYDLTDDRARTKVAKLLEGHGYERLQYSVFCGLEDPQRLAGLWAQLTSLCTAPTAGATARLCVLRVPVGHFRQMQCLGQPPDLDYLTGHQHTLIL
jgi:CRISPR-associated protein Cas2